MTEQRTIACAIDQYNRIADRLANCNVTGSYNNIIAFSDELRALGQFICDAFNFSGETDNRLFAVIDEQTNRITLEDN